MHIKELHANVQGNGELAARNFINAAVARHGGSYSSQMFVKEGDSIGKGPLRIGVNLTAMVVQRL